MFENPILISLLFGLISSMLYYGYNKYKNKKVKKKNKDSNVLLNCSIIFSIVFIITLIVKISLNNSPENVNTPLDSKGGEVSIITSTEPINNSSNIDINETPPF